MNCLYDQTHFLWRGKSAPQKMGSLFGDFVAIAILPRCFCKANDW
jgi:hypothetical protein